MSAPLHITKVALASAINHHVKTVDMLRATTKGGRIPSRRYRTGTGVVSPAVWPVDEVIDWLSNVLADFGPEHVERILAAAKPLDGFAATTPAA